MSVENPKQTTVFHDVISPRKTTNLPSPDPSREAKYKKGMALLLEGAKTEEYEQAKKKIGEAGKIFAELGFVRLMERCNRELIRRAVRAGRRADAAFYRATAAMAENRIDKIEEHLKDIPPDYEGREIIAAYAQRYRALEKMTVTFNAAQAIAQAHLSRMEEIEDSLIGGLVGPIIGTDFDPAREVIRAAIFAWNDRFQTGKFLSTRAILEDIWRNGPEEAKRGLAILAGHDDADKKSEELPATLEGALRVGRHFSNHVILSHLVEQEEKPDPEAFYNHLSHICTNADAEGKTQAAWVAGIYREVPQFRKEMGSLMAAEFEDRGVFETSRDFLTNAFQAENAVIMIGGFALARWTTSAVMARLAPGGIEGATLAARIAVPATEVGMEALGFTVYQRILTSLLTTQKVDWSLKSVVKDWAALTFSLGFLRATNTPLVSLRQTMGKTKLFGKPGTSPVTIGGQTLPQLNRFGNTLFHITQNITQTLAFYTGSQASHLLNISDMPPHLFEEWLTLLQFQMGVKLANIATNGFIERTAFQIRTRPIQKLSNAVAENLLGGKSEHAEALGRHIFITQVNGNVSLNSLARLYKSFEKGEADNVDTVLQANEVLQKAGLPIAFDGQRCYQATPEIHQAYIDALKAQQQGGDQLRPAFAMAGEGQINIKADARETPTTMAMGRSDGNPKGTKRKVGGRSKTGPTTNSNVTRWDKSTRKLYDRSPILQGVPKEALAIPKALLEWLISNRSLIVEEQRQIRGVNDEELKDYALSTLIGALAAGRKLTRNIPRYQRLAAARDLFDRSPILQGVPKEALATSKALLEWLISHRDLIVEEQRQIRGVNDEKLKNYALVTLIVALAAGRKLTGNIQQYQRLAAARDLFDRSPILQGIEKKYLGRPDALAEKLHELRPSIIEEQRNLRGFDARRENYAPSTLVEALWAGGRLTGDVQLYMRLAGARDLFEKSPTLKSIPNHVLDDNGSILRFLLTYRDRIAIENLRALGKLGPDEFGFANAWEHYALSTLVNALRAGGKIGEKRARKLNWTASTPLDYFMKRREVVEPAIRDLNSSNISIYGNLPKHTDRSPFTSLKDPSRTLHAKYIRNIILSGKWFMNDPEVVIRSIYNAEELAFLALVPPYFTGHADFVPASIAGRLEMAAEQSITAARKLKTATADGPKSARKRAKAYQYAAEGRREAVKCLQKILDHYASLRHKVDEHETEYLKQIGLLVEWNRDALRSKSSSSADDGLKYGGEGKSEDETHWIRNSRQFYHRSALLQEISDKELATPETALKKLIELRPLIVEEQRRVRNVDATRLPNYTLFTLMKALVAQGRITIIAHEYTRLAKGRDFYDRSPILQGIDEKVLVRPKALIDILLRLRPLIIEEQRSLRGKKIENLALTTLVTALKAGDRIQASYKTCMRLADARNLHVHSKILQGISQDILASPMLLINELSRLRTSIIEEQRSRQVEDAKKPPKYTLSKLVTSLDAEGKLPGNKEIYMRQAAARDLFERSPTLQNIPPGVLAESYALMRYLLAHRDRIAVESLLALGELDQGEFIFLGAHEHYSLKTLLHALHAGGLLGQKRYNSLAVSAAEPLEHFMKRRDAIGPTIRYLIHWGILKNILAHVDRGLFTRLTDTDNLLSDQSALKVIKMGRWFLTDPKAVTRSIYTAEELAFLASLPPRFTGYVDHVPAPIAGQLEGAVRRARTEPAEARRIAVKSLQDILHYYASEKGNNDEATAEYLKRIEQLLEWNRDALQGEVTSSTSKEFKSQANAISQSSQLRTTGQNHADRAFGESDWGRFAKWLFDNFPLLNGIDEKAIISSWTPVRKLSRPSLGTLVHDLERGDKIPPEEVKSYLPFAGPYDPFQNSKVLWDFGQKDRARPLTPIENSRAVVRVGSDSLTSPGKVKTDGASPVVWNLDALRQGTNQPAATNLAAQGTKGGNPRATHSRSITNPDYYVTAAKESQSGSKTKTTASASKKGKKKRLTDQQRVYLKTFFWNEVLPKNVIDRDYLDEIIDQLEAKGYLDGEIGQSFRIILEGVTVREGDHWKQKLRFVTIRTSSKTDALNTEAWRLYKRCELLHRIPKRYLSDAKRLIKELALLFPHIIDLESRRLGVDPKEIKDITYTALVRALKAAARIQGDIGEHLRVAADRDFYESSRILKEEITDEDLASPEAFIKRLVKLRPRLAMEQHGEQGKYEDKPIIYTLSRLVRVMALVAGNKFGTHVQKYVDLARDYDIFEHSEILRHETTKADLATAEALIEKLRHVLPRMAKEQRGVKADYEKPTHFTLYDLVLLLEIGGRITGDYQAYRDLARATDIYYGSKTLRGIPKEALASSKKLLKWMVEKRSQIIDDLQRAKAMDENELANLSYVTLIRARNVGRPLPGDVKEHMDYARRRDVYDRTPIIQDRINDADLDTPRLFIEELLRIFPDFVRKQRRGIDKKEPEDYTVGDLAQVLETAIDIPEKYVQLAKAYAIYDRSPTLQNISSRVRNDSRLLMRHLLAHRDRVAIENLQATGKLSKDEFIFPGAENYYSLATLVDALIAAGAFYERRTNRVRPKAAQALDYFLERRDVIEPKIGPLIRKKISSEQILKRVGTKLFTRLDDPTQRLNKREVLSVIKWGRWYLTQPEIITRTLYTTEELGFMALLAPYVPDPRYLVPHAIAHKIVAAMQLAKREPANARRQVVKGLQEILDYDYHLASESAKITKIAHTYLWWISRLIYWNRDTIKKMTGKNIERELSKIARSTLDRNVNPQERHAAVALMSETLEILQRSFIPSNVRKGEGPDKTTILATLWETHRFRYSDLIDHRWVDGLKYGFAKFVLDNATDLGLVGKQELPEKDLVKKKPSEQQSYAGTPRPPTGPSSEDH
jgi:hypothetical protein